MCSLSRNAVSWFFSALNYSLFTRMYLHNLVYFAYLYKRNRYSHLTRCTADTLLVVYLYSWHAWCFLSLALHAMPLMYCYFLCIIILRAVVIFWRGVLFKPPCLWLSPPMQWLLCFKKCNVIWWLLLMYCIMFIIAWK